MKARHKSENIDVDILQFQSTKLEHIAYCKVGTEIRVYPISDLEIIEDSDKSEKPIDSQKMFFEKLRKLLFPPECVANEAKFKNRIGGSEDTFGALADLEAEFNIQMRKDALRLLNEKREWIKEEVQNKGKINIKPIDNTSNWVKWMEESPNNGLQEHDLSHAVREIYQKVNEVIRALKPII